MRSASSKLFVLSVRMIALQCSVLLTTSLLDKGNEDEDVAFLVLVTRVDTHQGGGAGREIRIEPLCHRLM